MKSVNFRLTEKSIKDFLSGKRAYIRTRFYVFNSGDDWAVALIVRRPSNDVLQEIASVHVLALPSDTGFVDDPALEVLSASSMGAMREAVGKKCVVVRGRAEHISFFIEEKPYELTVFDVVPPSPSKLVGLVRTALENDLQDVYVRFNPVELDLNSLALQAKTKITMYPCRASGLVAGRRVLYLDETPPLTPEEVNEVTLIGCSLSARIFRAVYGSEPRLINMCPQDLAAQMKFEGPVLMKCCRIREGFEAKGNVAVVPWGVRSSEVTAALRKILR